MLKTQNSFEYLGCKKKKEEREEQLKCFILKLFLEMKSWCIRIDYMPLCNIDRSIIYKSFDIQKAHF